MGVLGVLRSLPLGWFKISQEFVGFLWTVDKFLMTFDGSRFFAGTYWIFIQRRLFLGWLKFPKIFLGERALTLWWRVLMGSWYFGFGFSDFPLFLPLFPPPCLSFFLFSLLSSSSWGRPGFSFSFFLSPLLGGHRRRSSP